MYHPSAHVDTFTRDNLPPPPELARMDLGLLPETAAYPARMNCATELLDKQAAAQGERPVFHGPDGTWSYRELLAKANRIAHVLVGECGIVPGNRVLIRSPNSPMMVACWMAVMKAGAVCVATMPLLRARELAFICDKARIALALCDHRLLPDLDEAKGRAEHLSRIVTWGDGTLEDLMAAEPDGFQNVDTAQDDVCLIAFTSGTTGQPKGCMHFHRDVLAMCDSFSRYVLEPGPDDVFIGSPPVAFTFGLGAQVAFPMHAGASTILLEQFTPDQLLETIQSRKATVLFTAPTAYRVMSDMAKDYDLSSLRKCVSAGETLPRPTFEAWEAATGIKTIDGLGSTEMIHIFVSAAGDAIRPGATGRAIPGYEARVVDDDGNDVPPGTVGHLAVRGVTGCKYLDNPERQAVYVRDGWNYPGDSYLIDQDGNFFYQARTDDMIISAGYNISGPEVEAVLLEHPKVLECGVVGVPDPDRGRIVAAFVVLRDKDQAGAQTVQQLQDFVKAEIAPYKYPRQITFLDELPKTQTGKLQRFKLRDR